MNKISENNTLAGKQTVWITDFDGIIGSDMIYSREGKEFKTINLGVRDALKLLKAHGQEIHCVTSDSSNVGQLISKQLCESYGIGWHAVKSPEDKLNVIFEICAGREFIYIGDDLFDANIARYAKMFFFPASGPLAKIVEKLQMNGSRDQFLLVPLKSDRLLLEAVAQIIRPELLAEYLNTKQTPGPAYIQFLTGVNPLQFHDWGSLVKTIGCELYAQKHPYNQRVSEFTIEAGTCFIKANGYPSVAITSYPNYVHQSSNWVTYYV